jgi:hypothetical protein
MVLAAAVGSAGRRLQLHVRQLQMLLLLLLKGLGCQVWKSCI